ncbi:MAG: tRNA-uridine aminocarboxypropyltransferase [Bdellovibrionota bacterium]
MHSESDIDSEDDIEEAPLKIEDSKARARAQLGLEVPVEAFPNSVRVLVLQHPQEPDKELGTASLLVRALDKAELRVGLSWKSLKQLAGNDVVPGTWAVLYLGPKGRNYTQPVNFVNNKGELVPNSANIQGLVVLDGTWSQAKALWWRNSWLTKLKRVVLQPARPSAYGRLRKEPRAEALSTIESAALALSKIDPKGAQLQTHLEDAFARMLETYKKRPRAP